MSKGSSRLPPRKRQGHGLGLSHRLRHRQAVGGSSSRLPSGRDRLASISPSTGRGKAGKASRGNKAWRRAVGHLGRAAGEDEPMVRHRSRAALVSHGYTVITATNRRGSARKCGPGRAHPCSQRRRDAGDGWPTMVREAPRTGPSARSCSCRVTRGAIAQLDRHRHVPSAQPFSVQDAEAERKHWRLTKSFHPGTAVSVSRNDRFRTLPSSRRAADRQDARDFLDRSAIPPGTCDSVACALREATRRLDLAILSRSEGERMAVRCACAEKRCRSCSRPAPRRPPPPS